MCFIKKIRTVGAHNLAADCRNRKTTTAQNPVQ